LEPLARHQTEMTMRISKITLMTAVVLAASSASADAGQYHVYSCRMPSGQSAPVDGWIGSIAKGSAYDDYTKDTCPGAGALIAALGEQTSHLSDVDLATWSFSVPASETIAGATLWRVGNLHGGSGENSTYQFWLAGPTMSKVFDECIYTLKCSGQGELAEPLAIANRLAVPSGNLGSHLYVNVSCAAGFQEVECKNGFGDPNGYAAAVYLFAADLTLEQTAGPSASNVSGELASAPAVAGTSDVAFTASDPGSGVYQALFSVDGQVVQSTVLNQNGGRCRNVGQTTDGLPAFLYVQPCLASVSADVGFDTTKVSDGSHHLVLSVIDAAGNAAPVLDRTITVANRPAAGTQGPANGANGTNGANGANGTNGQAGQPNGVVASSQAILTVQWTGTKNERLTSSYSRMNTIVGRLTAPSGVPIVGAQIDLVAGPSYTGARPVTMTSPRTGSDGTFSVRLPGGTRSETLHFAYRSRLGDVVPVATRTLTLSVRAGIALSIRPRLASVGRSIVFRGQLLGGSIPRGGKQLVLEARSTRGSWLEFNVIRANARGLYRASYRFKFPGPIRYQFRVVSEPEADYPFAAGSSNVVAVRER
jgi:hypothetical protein